MTLSLIIIFFLSSACGLKVREDLSENVLLGSWKLTKLSCLSSTDSSVEKEKYEFDSKATIVISFIENKINYSSSEGACSTSSTGNYITNFNGTSTGVLDIVDVITGGTSCEESISDSSSNSVGTTVIPTTLTGAFSTNLSWVVSTERDFLELDYFTNFKGSISDSGCAEACVCKAYFSKN